MKKFVYIALLAIASSMTIVSCTEEEVAPSTENGGAAPIPDKGF
ncbi:MAG: hypothetical protein WA874_12180 [Chryseosolibacter sp.]